MVIGPNFVYIGIPRTASNTMSRLFLPQFGGISDGKDHNRSIPPDDITKFTFAVVRNPYDRILSSWYHNRRCSPDPAFHTITFLEFVDRLITNWDEAGSSQSEFLSTLRIDRVLKYESLASDVLTLPFNRACIPWPSTRLNNEDRPVWHQELMEHPEYAEAVERHSKPDFERFRYPLWPPWITQ